MGNRPDSAAAKSKPLGVFLALIVVTGCQATPRNDGATGKASSSATPAPPSGTMTATASAAPSAAPASVLPTLDEDGQPVRVRFGRIEATGTSEEAARQLLEGEQAKLGACYQQYRSTHDQGMGRYAIAADLGAAGKVTAATKGSTDFKDGDAFGSCLVRAFGTLTFPEMKGAGGKITAHMVFVPEWPRAEAKP